MMCVFFFFFFFPLSLKGSLQPSIQFLLWRVFARRRDTELPTLKECRCLNAQLWDLPLTPQFSLPLKSGVDGGVTSFLQQC